MKKIILSTIAGLALTSAAFASESGDSYPQDQTTLFAVQRGETGAPPAYAVDRAYGRQAYRATVTAPRAQSNRSYDAALANATSGLDRESDAN